MYFNCQISETFSLIKESIFIKIGTNFVEDKLHSVKRSSKLDVFHSFALSLYQIN